MGFKPVLRFMRLGIRVNPVLIRVQEGPVCVRLRRVGCEPLELIIDDLLWLIRFLGTRGSTAGNDRGRCPRAPGICRVSPAAWQESKAIPPYRRHGPCRRTAAAPGVPAGRAGSRTRYVVFGVPTYAPQQQSQSPCDGRWRQEASRAYCSCYWPNATNAGGLGAEPPRGPEVRKIRMSQVCSRAFARFVHGKNGAVAGRGLQRRRRRERACRLTGEYQVTAWSETRRWLPYHGHAGSPACDDDVAS